MLVLLQYLNPTQFDRNKDTEVKALVAQMALMVQVQCDAVYK
jgi:hypothetical protein